MKLKLKEVQAAIGKPVIHKWPPLTGVYHRLWEDAGMKEERMVQLRQTIDQMIQ